MTRQASNRSVDAVIAELATRQHGVIARLQLLAAGLSPSQIDGRVRRGLLIPLYRGVYAVGHARVSREGRSLAAVLACGPLAVLSHRSAAAHWGVRPSAGSRVEVTSPGFGRRASGILGHRMALDRWERTEHDAIPITTPARTLLDLAEVVPRQALERAVGQAEVLRLFDLTAIERVLDAHPHRHGTPRLRAVLTDAGIGENLTRSELEERVLTICDRHGLPRPMINARVAGLEVDFHWPAARLVVEADSRRYHHTRSAFERDRERDAHLVLHGLRVVRLTSRRILREPEAVGRTLGALVYGVTAPRM